VEEDAILVVGKGVVDFLIPYDTSALGRNVHHLEPKRISNKVVREHDRALQPGVGPSLPVGVGNVQLCDSDGVNLVSGLGHGALHHLLVLVRENRRHDGVLRGLELEMVVVRVKAWSRTAVGLWRVQLSGGVLLTR